MEVLMKTIVAIGGGEIGDLETLKIDKEIVNFTKKTHPKALFIPTASHDAKEYWKFFQKVYKDMLGCDVYELFLSKENPTQKQVEEKILGADLIYVGGGDTKYMLNIWEKFNVNKYLRKAWEKGIVLSGLSAGSICWFKYGHSDSESFLDGKTWIYTKLPGLNFINAFHCPHYNENSRRESFNEMITNYNGVGIALEDCVAIVFMDDRFKIIKSSDDAKGYRLYRKDGKVIEEIIEESPEFSKIDKLFAI